jgi:hypothetical protein
LGDYRRSVEGFLINRLLSGPQPQDWEQIWEQNSAKLAQTDATRRQR